MCAEPHSSGKGKVLIVGGGIANFTNVAETFKGLPLILLVGLLLKNTF
jgi:hypothetical protein